MTVIGDITSTIRAVAFALHYGVTEMTKVSS